MNKSSYQRFERDYLEMLLLTLGEVKSERRLTREGRKIDIWFVPRANLTEEELESLGLLGRLIKASAESPESREGSSIAEEPPNACMFELFYNPVEEEEIFFCMLQLFRARSEARERVEASKAGEPWKRLPKLWIITPTASEDLLAGLAATPIDDGAWPGVYWMGSSMRGGIVVVSQLDRTPETLWLRLLGRESVGLQAIDELGIGNRE